MMTFHADATRRLVLVDADILAKGVNDRKIVMQRPTIVNGFAAAHLGYVDPT